MLRVLRDRRRCPGRRQRILMPGAVSAITLERYWRITQALPLQARSNADRSADPTVPRRPRAARPPRF